MKCQMVVALIHPKKCAKSIFSWLAIIALIKGPNSVNLMRAKENIFSIKLREHVKCQMLDKLSMQIFVALCVDH